MLNIRDVRKCRNSLELNAFIEKYIAEGNAPGDSFDRIYHLLYQDWRKTLKKKPTRMP